MTNSNFQYLSKILSKICFLFEFGKKKILTFWRKFTKFLTSQNWKKKKEKKKAQGIQNPGPIIEGRANQLFCLF
jgi:hypothetical protein